MLVGSKLALHTVEQGECLRAVAVCEPLVDGGAPHRRAGGVRRGSLGLAIHAGELLGGAGVGLGEAGELVVVVVLELGGALNQGLALADDLAGEFVALGGDMADDAVAGIVEVGVEPGAEHEAGAVVAGGVERGGPQVVQPVEDAGCAVDRVGAGRTVVGIGRGGTAPPACRR